ncbi:MAG: hypothetical protein ACREAE_03970 [Nitrosopumilaceae archaeon]
MSELERISPDAALYLFCIMNQEKKYQDDIAKASGVTTVMIRKSARSLRKDLT